MACLALQFNPYSYSNKVHNFEDNKTIFFDRVEQNHLYFIIRNESYDVWFHRGMKGRFTPDERACRAAGKYFYCVCVNSLVLS